MSEKEKMNVNTAPAADASTGTAEDVEAIMKRLTGTHPISP